MSAWFHEDFARTYEDYPNRDHTEALAAGERLLARPDFPHEELLRKNLTWFLPQLPGSNHDITIPAPEGWSCLNPSIASDPDGNLRVIIRTVNYVLSPEGRYGGAYDDDGIIRTANYIADVHGVKIDNLDPIDDREHRPDEPLYPVEGFEDCRLFYFEGWKFSATVRERNTRGICQQVVCTLNQNNEVWNIAVLSRPHAAHQKNWMPMNAGEFPGFITTCYPLKTCSLNARIDISVPSPWIAHDFRGGAVAGTVAGHGVLAIIHESVDFPGQAPHRVYWHRFMLLTAGVMAKVSPPFCFQGRGVEFAAGMAMDGRDLLISYGLADKAAWLHRMPLDDALGMLRDVTEES